MPTLGTPHIHYRQTDSTNLRARALAQRDAPHGTTVTADEQTAGRGRQGRSWHAAAGSGLLISVVVRNPPQLLPLRAGLAVAETAATYTDSVVKLKWPNDVLLKGRKLSGILVEGSPQQGWAVVGIGLNTSVEIDRLPEELKVKTASLRLPQKTQMEVRERLISQLQRWFSAPTEKVLKRFAAQDALIGRPVRWNKGEGTAEGIDDQGRLIVKGRDGSNHLLAAGEVHLSDSHHNR